MSLETGRAQHQPSAHQRAERADRAHQPGAGVSVLEAVERVDGDDGPAQTECQAEKARDQPQEPSHLTRAIFLDCTCPGDRSSATYIPDATGLPWSSSPSQTWASTPAGTS